MAHLQYMPGDPRLVDQLVYELKSKGIFDQFRKDCIADVDTRPAYQNLRQRVESSVSTFLSRQCWQPDLNKNQLREKLRKHILDGNYLEQGVERIVDQVVNPKVASVFIPQVEDLVYNYLGITRKKTAETSTNGKIEDLLPTDLEAVSPGSVKSNDDNDEAMDMDTESKDDTKMEVDQEPALKPELKEENVATPETTDTEKTGSSVQVIETSVTTVTIIDSDSCKSNIPLPADDIKPEDIPSPLDTPPKIELEVEKIELPKEIAPTDIPLPDEIRQDQKDEYFKTINSDEDESSSDSSIRRNMSPLTPIRNFNNENSCDAQQAFENVSDSKTTEKLEPSTFRFTIDAKAPENGTDVKKEKDQVHLSYQFNEQMNINNFNTPMYDDSSNSNNLHIDYESDANSKANIELKATEEQSMDETKKDRKVEEKKSSHKSSHRSRDSSKQSSSKDKRSDSKPSSSRDSSRHDKKSSRDDHKSKSSHGKSSDRSDRKDSDKKDKESSKHRSSHKSSSHRDSKSHKSSSTSSSQRHSSKHSDDKKSSSSSHREKCDKSSERSSDKSSKERSSRDSKSSSHRSDKDRKSSSSSKSSKTDEKERDKKSKKEIDDHYSLSGRGNPNRRSTDRDSNDGSSSSKGSHNPSSSKSSASQKESKGSSSKSDNTSPSGDSTSPSDKDHKVDETKSSKVVPPKPIIRVDTRLELPMASPPRLPFVPDVTLKKPKFAANLQEAKKFMKMRKFLDEEQKRMNQEAALLLEFQANVRPSLSQVYSNIPGPELEFACVINNEQGQVIQNNPASAKGDESIRISNPTNALLAVVNAQKIEDITGIESELSNLTESNDSKETSDDSLHETEVPVMETIEESINKEESEQVSVPKDDDSVDINNIAEARVPDIGDEIDDVKQTTVTEIDCGNEVNDKSVIEINSCGNSEDDTTDKTEYFEITVIAESEDEEETVSEKLINKITQNSEVLDNNNTVTKETRQINEEDCPFDEEMLKFFTETETNDAQSQLDEFSKFLKAYTERQTSNKVYLINCDTYEESVVKDVLAVQGNYETVNFHKNGYLKVPKTKRNIVKNVNVASELSLPFDNNEFVSAANELEMDLRATRNIVLSPVKSECSFELSNDYDTKLNEMVNNASRQQIMEIILGNAMSSESPTKMPKIDYVTECNIDSEANNLKRKLGELETTVNNNRTVLTPKRMRKLSTSEQITSTTEESGEQESNTLQKGVRSKYLGRARRVGLPRPRKADQPNSPSSDKSVENYEQNTKEATVAPATPNGKLKTPQRNKIQRYDTSDLYKPKLHYLSRRNNIS